MSPRLRVTLLLLFLVPLGACGAQFPTTTGPSQRASFRVLFPVGGTEWPIPLGEGAALLRAYTVDADGGWSDSVPDLTCSSSNVTVATISTTTGFGSYCGATGRAPGSALLNAVSGGQAISTDIAFATPAYPVMRIVWQSTVPLQVAALPMHGTLQARIFTSINSTSQDVTASATWSTSDPTVATMSGNAFTGHMPGNVEITANALGRTARIRIGVPPKAR